MVPNENPGGRFGATSLTALSIQPIYRENGSNGLNTCYTLGPVRLSVKQPYNRFNFF